jgi:Flp pilus assembly protein TadG
MRRPFLHRKFSLERLGSRGAAATELAIVLPFLLLVIFACLDYGRAIYGQIALTNAVRVGAERGATKRFTSVDRVQWETLIRSAAEAEAASIPGYVASRLTLQITTSNDFGALLQVQVTGQYSFRTLISWPGVPQTLALRHQVAMRQYQ